jgi:hypothetical protein
MGRVRNFFYYISIILQVIQMCDLAIDSIGAGPKEQWKFQLSV